MKYCSHCAGELFLTVPEGDDRERHVCAECTAIHYINPRIITGCLPVHENRVLLCRRSIEPRRGYWTLPAGFLENGETVADGAIRETREEAQARVDLEQLYGVVDIPHIAQIYIIYRATLRDLDFGPGEESLETALFGEQEIPWSELAFPVIDLMLRHYFDDVKRGSFSLKTGKIDFSQRLRRNDDTR